MSEYGGLYIVRPSSFTNVEWLELYALSAVEVNQAMRLRSVHSRAAYVACRLLLRALVSTYAQVPVDQFEIGQGEYGKPVVTYPTGKCVEFNISHSHPVSVLAMAPAVPIGVDVVEVAEVPEGRGFARRVLTDRELGEWSALQDNRRAEWLGRVWAAKESYLKWIGVGLKVDPRTVDVCWLDGMSFRAAEEKGAFPEAYGSWRVYEGCQIAFVPGDLDLSMVLAPRRSVLDHLTCQGFSELT